MRCATSITPAHAQQLPPSLTTDNEQRATKPGHNAHIVYKDTHHAFREARTFGSGCQLLVVRNAKRAMLGYDNACSRPTATTRPNN
jgi:hypothetical protein